MQQNRKQNIFMCILSMLFSTAYASDQLKKIVVVETIEFQSTEDSYITNAAKERIRKLGFINIEINQDETDLKVSIYNEACLGVEGCEAKAKKLGADYILKTQITEVSGRCAVQVKKKSILNNTQDIETKHAACDRLDITRKLESAITDVMREKLGKMSGEVDAIIKSEPSGAKVIINHNYVCDTPCETKVPLGEIDVVISLDNNKFYNPGGGIVVLEDASKKWEPTYRLGKKPSMIIPSIDPEGAEIKINGKNRSYEQGGEIYVESFKDLKIEINLEKYEKITKTINSLDPGESFDLKVKLRPLPCKVMILSSGEGGKILKEGKVIDSLPMTKDLEPGEYIFQGQLERHTAEPIRFNCQPGERITETFEFKRMKYSEEEQERIDNSKFWRKTSYVGLGLSIGLAYKAYEGYSDYNQIDSKYKTTQDPFEMEKLKAERDDAKKTFALYSVAAVVGTSLTYLFYRMGDFPEDLKHRDTTFSISPTQGGGVIAWQKSF